METNEKAKITPFLWFDGNVDEAIKFYTSVFTDSKVLNVNKAIEGMNWKAGTTYLATLVLKGQKIVLMDGGPQYKFNPSFSFYVDCETQQEVDWLWEKLCEGGGHEVQCGWLQDKFGLSWQIIPIALTKYISDPDPKKAKRVFDAMLKMKKIIIKDLEDAYNQK